MNSGLAASEAMEEEGTRAGSTRIRENLDQPVLPRPTPKEIEQAAPPATNRRPAKQPACSSDATRRSPKCSKPTTRECSRCRTARAAGSAPLRKNLERDRPPAALPRKIAQAAAPGMPARPANRQPRTQNDATTQRLDDQQKTGHASPQHTHQTASPPENFAASSSEVFTEKI